MNRDERDELALQIAETLASWVAERKTNEPFSMHDATLMQFMLEDLIEVFDLDARHRYDEFAGHRQSSNEFVFAESPDSWSSYLDAQGVERDDAEDVTTLTPLRL